MRIILRIMPVFCLMSDPVECHKTRKKQHACNTTKYCDNLQCCLSTGIYRKCDNLKFYAVTENEMCRYIAMTMIIFDISGVEQCVIFLKSS